MEAQFKELAYADWKQLVIDTYNQMSICYETKDSIPEILYSLNVPAFNERGVCNIVKEFYPIIDEEAINKIISFKKHFAPSYYKEPTTRLYDYIIEMEEYMNGTLNENSIRRSDNMKRKLIKNTLKQMSKILLGQKSNYWSETLP